MPTTKVSSALSSAILAMMAAFWASVMVITIGVSVDAIVGILPPLLGACPFQVYFLDQVNLVFDQVIGWLMSRLVHNPGKIGRKSY